MAGTPRQLALRLLVLPLLRFFDLFRGRRSVPGWIRRLLFDAIGCSRSGGLPSVVMIASLPQSAQACPHEHRPRLDSCREFGAHRVGH